MKVKYFKRINFRDDYFSQWLIFVRTKSQKFVPRKYLIHEITTSDVCKQLIKTPELKQMSKIWIINWI